MGDTVFVTGGTGLLGTPIVRRLVQEGRPVRALSRSPNADETLAAAGCTPVRGDILEPDGLVDAMKGCEVAYHIAGSNAFCLPDRAPLYRVNVWGSENVVRAAAEAGVRRVVYTSSAATLGERKGTVGDEASPHRGSFLSHYERSKYLAERAVWRAARQGAIDVVAVNPSSVQGPGRTGGTARLILGFVNGKLKVGLDTRMSLIDVADCTEGHLLAEEKATPGERYVLSGATLTVGQALSILREVTGVTDSPVMMPPVVAIAAGAVVEALARMRKRHASLCPEMVRTLLHGHAYDGSRATRELGLRYTPVDHTLRRTVTWYVEQGLVTRPLPRFGVKGS